jgi:tetratricopeptide (TPR) repeat protein
MRSRAAALIFILAAAFASSAGIARAAPPPDASPQPEAEAPEPPKPSEVRAELYQRLSASADADETEGLVKQLLAAYQQSGSDTADFLLEGAHKAIEAKDYKNAEKILDSAIGFLPDWAEGWNARAAVRYLDGDPDGSMTDIAQTLRLEPRHLGALVGMASILQSRGKDDDALKVYERALVIAPHWKSAEEAEDKLRKKLASETL